MTSIRQRQMRWECNREIRQTHEKECAFFMRTNSCLPKSTGGNRANRGSNPSPFPPLAPVQTAQGALAAERTKTERRGGCWIRPTAVQESWVADARDATTIHPLRLARRRARKTKL